ncbi:MAG TPA: cytochrome c oxidase subunit 3 [Gemmatimonadaceae bacterium]
MTSLAHPPDAPPPARLTIDVSELPTTTFGRRNLNWWGTVGFMAIEGTTMIVAAAALLYIRGNFDSWPPRPILPPHLGVPSLVLLLLLVKLVPAWYAIDSAQRLDRAASRRWMALALLLGTAATAFRLLEFDSLNVRWDTNAYGSIVWTILGLHTFLLVFDVLETAAILLLLGDEERLRTKHYADVEDASVYEFFLSLSWVPLFLLVYLLPRIG